jgi:hypothetical protein
VHQLGLYKTYLYFRGKDAMIKDFKLEKLICFNPPITEHQTPLHQTTRIFHIQLSNWVTFVALETLGAGIQMFFELRGIL